MRQSFRSLLCVLTLSAGRVLAQSDPGAMPSPPPPKGPPTKVLPQTNPNKAPAGGEIRKAVRVPSGPAAPTGPIPPGKAGGEMLLQMAFASYESGNSALALEQLDQAEKLKPNVADAWNLRGAILLRQNDYNRAEAAFKRAVNLDPDLWAAKFNVAEIPFRRKEYAKALKNFEDLSIQTDRYKLAIEWELLQYKLVVCSLLLNDEPGAQKRFGRLRPGGASPAYFYCQAAFAFAKKDKEGANKFLSYADASSRPGMRSIFSDTLVRVGWVAGGSVTYDPTQGQSSGPRSRGLPVPVLPPPIDLDLPSGAGGIASPDVPGGPKSEPPLAGPGEAAAPKEKPAEDAKPEGKPESKSEAKPALTPPPLKEPKPNASLRSLPGWIAVRSFSPRAQDGASSDYRRIANQPDAYAAKLREAQLKLRAKEFDTASRLLQEAIGLTDNPAEVHNLRGAIEFYRGDFPKAEALFRQALAADPASWPARFNLAEIAFAKKEYAAARELYEAMLPETDTLKQPVEREMLQFKVVLSLLQEGKVELAQRIAERLPLAGQTPARYYCQVALEAHAKRYDKAAEVLNSAEQFYATSLNFLFSQSLEKLGILPLPNTAAASPPAATPAPTAAATPPPVAAATPAPVASSLPKKTEPPRSPESQMLDEIVSGRAMSPATPAAALTTAAGAAPAAAVAAPARVAPPRSADAPQGWLAEVVRSLFPGSEPTRLEVLLFALGVLNLLGMLWLMGNEVFTRWIRPRSLSLHTAGSVGVAVNKVRNIERLRIRFSIANMTTRSQTVGQLDAVMSGQGDWKRTFHWRKLCLNPSGNSAAFEEMDVYPLVLLPGEVASLYVDFVADGSDAPAQWAKGSYRIEVLGWTEAHAGRSRPDFKAVFPLEVPSIPWRNQELLVDLAIDRSKDGKPRQPQFLDTEEIEARNAAAAAAEDHAKYSGAAPAAPASAAPAAGSPSATTKTTTPPRQARKPVEAGPELPLFQQTAVATASAAETIVPTAEASVAIPPPEPAPLVGVQPEPTRNARAEAPAATQTVAPPARPLPPIATHPAARPSNRPPGTTLVPLPPRASESVAAPAPPPPAKDLARANLGPRHRR
ncbi:MAG: tetratricopeptide repeat protein [Verrucomicrobia bacterium]|nr:tetratricopeptide repeat protein [Verrucomicrobiota bacterium]